MQVSPRSCISQSVPLTVEGELKETTRKPEGSRGTESAVDAASTGANTSWETDPDMAAVSGRP